MALLNIEPEQRQGLLYSIGLHLGIVLLLMMSTQQHSITPPKGNSIQAEIMDLDEFMKTMPKPKEDKPKENKPVEKPPIKEQPKPEPVKPEPIKPAPVKPEPKVEPKPIIKPQVNEVKREEKTERQKKLEDLRRQRQEAEVAAKQQPEMNTPAEAEQAIEAPAISGVESGAEKAKRTLLTQYMGAIQSAVTRQWARPSGTPAGLMCQIKVNQIPGGGVIDVSIGTPCNASAVVRNSIINAVKKADPLPYSGFEEVFDRRLNFIFQYQGD